MTIHELQGLLKRKETSAEEITRSVLQRIEAVEEKVKAYLRLTPEAALTQAKAVDK